MMLAGSDTTMSTEDDADCGAFREVVDKAFV